MLKLFKTKLWMAFGLTVSFLMSGMAFAEPYVGQVNEIDSESNSILISDAPFYYSNYTIVQKYPALESERLSFANVAKNDWVRLDIEYDPNLDGFVIRKIEILPNAEKAIQLEAQLYEDD